MKVIEVKKGVVIFSGGQDSTTILFWAIKMLGVENVEAITFAYGQKHSIEVEQSKIICDLLKVKQTIVDISFLNTLVESALTSNGDVNEINAKGLPASFVPNRNQLFITLAHAYAQKINAQWLVTGVCQTDYSGYPDCRHNFIQEIEKASNLGSDSNISIQTPLMYLNKKETWALANELGCLKWVVELSHTCYNGNRLKFNDWGYGCGECPACELRKKGYYEYIQENQNSHKNE
ncbi:MAG: Cellulophaga phage phiSM [Bacteroidota bacterium]|jgi:7-cyano-7-deazaguanine synthase